MLKEPPKESVFSAAAYPVNREATAVLFDNAANTAYDVVMDLTAGVETSRVAASTGYQPFITLDEMEECEKAVLASDEFKAALKKHYNLDSTELCMVDIWSVGYYGENDQKDDYRDRKIERETFSLKIENGEAR